MLRHPWVWKGLQRPRPPRSTQRSCDLRRISPNALCSGSASQPSHSHQTSCFGWAGQAEGAAGYESDGTGSYGLSSVSSRKRSGRHLSFPKGQRDHLGNLGLLSCAECPWLGSSKSTHGYPRAHYDDDEEPFALGPPSVCAMTRNTTFLPLPLPVYMIRNPSRSLEGRYLAPWV